MIAQLFSLSVSPDIPFVIREVVRGKSGLTTGDLIQIVRAELNGIEISESDVREIIRQAQTELRISPRSGNPLVQYMWTEFEANPDIGIGEMMIRIGRRYDTFAIPTYTAMKWLIKWKTERSLDLLK